MRAECAGHNAEQTPFGQRHNGAEELFGLSPGQRNHRIAHDWNAGIISQAARHLFAIDEPDGHLRI